MAELRVRVKCGPWWQFKMCTLYFLKTAVGIPTHIAAQKAVTVVATRQKT